MRARGSLLVVLAVSAAVLGATGASASPGLRSADVRAHHGPIAHIAAAFSSGGGKVLHYNRAHLVFWQPAGSGMTFDPGYESLVETFMTDVAAASHSPSNVYGLTGQYTDSRGPAAYVTRYAGAVQDVDPLPSNQCAEPLTTGPGWSVCLTDAQLQTELEQVVNSGGLPATGSNIYILVLPNGFGTCMDSSSSSCALGGSATGYCGYHSQTLDSMGLLYAVIPYNAIEGHCQSGNPRPNNSTADPALSTIAHEQIETITDPEGDGWTDSAGNEIADLCITDFGAPLGGSGQSAWNEVINGDHYWLQEVWSRAAHACEPRAPNDPTWFSWAGRARARTAVTFTGHGIDPQGRVTAWQWTFGDGTVSHRRVALHTFAHSGTYTVTLRITDSAGNWSYATRTVRVFAGRH